MWEAPPNFWLLGAGLLAILIGLAHSVLGEWLLLGPLFARGELTKLVGSRTFARRTLRFAWHVTTVLLVGIGGVVLYLAFSTVQTQTSSILRSLAIIFAVCSALSLIGARGKHFSWWVFLVIAALLWIGA